MAYGRTRFHLRSRILSYSLTSLSYTPLNCTPNPYRGFACDPQFVVQYFAEWGPVDSQPAGKTLGTLKWRYAATEKEFHTGVFVLGANHRELSKGLVYFRGDSPLLISFVTATSTGRLRRL